LEIGLEGTGDWRLHEVTVYINQDFAPIFSKTWSNDLLLNGGDSVVIFRDEYVEI